MRLSAIFDELLSNVVSYAYHDDEHETEVRFGLALEDRNVGGMGIHLVRNLVDDVFYRRRTDKNVLTLMSHLQQEEDAA